MSLGMVRSERLRRTGPCAWARMAVVYLGLGVLCPASAVTVKDNLYGVKALSRTEAVAVGNFGSGWTWLVKKPDGTVDIVNTGAAGTPLTTTDKALLTVDVWEHAYYIDYRNMRPKFVETFLASLVNWSFAEANFA